MAETKNTCKGNKRAPAPASIASSNVPACPSAIQAFCDFHEEYVSRNIQLADAKAGLVLIAFSGTLALSLKAAGFLSIIRNSFGWPWPISQPFSIEATIAWIGLGLCLVGIGLSFLVIAPRFTAASDEKWPGKLLSGLTGIFDFRAPGGGVTYFGNVASFSTKVAYADRMLSISEVDLNRDRLQHLHQLSVICWRKMCLLEPAMWLGGAGVVVLAAWLTSFAERLG